MDPRVWGSACSACRTKYRAADHLAEDASRAAHHSCSPRTASGLDCLLRAHAGTHCKTFALMRTKQQESKLYVRAGRHLAAILDA